MSAVGFQSDSQLLVDTCLARLRVDARLDDEPILPTIDVLPDVSYDFDVDDDDDDDFIEVDTCDLVVVECKSVRDLPSAASIVRESVKANQRERQVPTLRRVRTAQEAARVKHARWPVVLCALVATYCGLTAFIKSPLGAKPEVQHVVKVSRGHIANAIQTTKSLVRR